MNLVEKIVQRFLVTKGVSLPRVSAGDFVSVRPAHVMTHDNTSPVISKFKGLGAKQIADSKQPVFTLDHNVQDKSESNLKKYAAIREFARVHGIDFYPAGRGIGHQVMVEEGYAFPGTLVVASDSHSNMYGGLGCLGTPVVRTDAASIWATTKTWWQVPPVANVVLDGELQPGVSGKDVIITLCGLYNKDEVLNHAIEFTGPGVNKLSIDERLCIANMTTEWGALCGIFPIDTITFKWLQTRSEYLAKRGPSGVVSDSLSSSNYSHPRVNSKTIKNLKDGLLEADNKARYSKTIHLSLDKVTPHVSGPNHVKTMKSVRDIEKENVKIQKAYIVSCVNSRADDLSEAAKIIKGKKVAEGVKLYVAPASSEVLQESKHRGDWEALLKAGAIELPAGCGPCIGLGAGLLEDGEVGISATNRNFKGRMGSPKAQAYLASPAVVAASAISGKISAPQGSSVSSSEGPAYQLTQPKKQEGNQQRTLIPLIDGFPRQITGEVVFCDADNINTDGIYPGKYTYRDDIKKDEMGRVAMENYDIKFSEVCKSGDILVSGYNFGTGSSREQAATCLKYKGIPLVLAGSFNATYVRNAFNNGLLVLESPKLIEFLRASKEPAQGTLRIGSITINLEKWEAELTTSVGQVSIFPLIPIGDAAQDLIVTDGLENWIIAQSKKISSETK